MKTYIYKGQKVFLAYMDQMPGVKPLEDDGETGCYPIELYNGCSTCCSIDESYDGEYDTEDEIVYTECQNIENEQGLCPGWYTRDYAVVDEFRRELCVNTTRYHRWTSELSRLIRAIWDKQEDYAIPKWWADSERESWKETIERYRKNISADNQLELPYVMTFDEILEQEGIKIEED